MAISYEPIADRASAPVLRQPESVYRSSVARRLSRRTTVPWAPFGRYEARCLSRRRNSQGRTVWEGADGKGPEPRAPRRRPTSLRGVVARGCETAPDGHPTGEVLAQLRVSSESSIGSGLHRWGLRVRKNDSRGRVGRVNSCRRYQGLT